MTRSFLEHTNGDHVGKLIELDHNELIVGRIADCDIVTESKFSSVSQRHALLQRTTKGWTITDIGTQGKGSSYGTYVNDIRLEPNTRSILRSGDEIRLGTKLGKYFKFHGEGTVPVSQPLNLKGRFIIDADKRCILVDGRAIQISLTPQEFEFLSVLWEKSGSICLFREIYAGLWPEDKTLEISSGDADLRVRVNTLSYGVRRKLKFALDGIDILESCRGVGYRLRL